MRECITTAHAHSNKKAAIAAHLQLGPAACSGGVTSTQGGGEAAKLQVGAAAWKHQKFGFEIGGYIAE